VVGRIRRLPAGFLAVAGATAWSILVIVGAYTVPLYSCAGDCSAEDATLVGQNGTGVLIPVSIPLIASLACWGCLRLYCTRGGPWRSIAWVFAVAAMVLTVLGALTIGMFVAPTAVLLVVACGTTQPPAVTAPPPSWT
jgi:hypothetical protein